MPAPAPPTGPAVGALLTALGAAVRARRKALGVSATTAAESAGISRVTLHRIEKGEPSVTFGAVAAAAAAVGLAVVVVDPQQQQQAHETSLPAKLRVAQYPWLRRIAWQLGDDAEVTPHEALALYERNWRHVDKDALDDDERDLVRRLVAAHGGALLV